jgi:hypothetical protein
MVNGNLPVDTALVIHPAQVCNYQESVIEKREITGRKTDCRSSKTKIIPLPEQIPAMLPFFSQLTPV